MNSTPSKSNKQNIDTDEEFFIDDGDNDDSVRDPPVLTRQAPLYSTPVEQVQTQNANTNTHTANHTLLSPSNTIDAMASSSSSNSAQNHTNTHRDSLTRRVRQYNTASKGPFTVFIREIEDKIAPITFIKYINVRYPSTLSSTRGPGTIKVTLNNVHEANALAADNKFANYHVSIPADHVEIEGAIDFNDLCDLTDMDLLCESGTGVFNNAAIPPCKIINAERLLRAQVNLPGCERITSMTNTVKIIFDGKILPNYINFLGLRVRVRPFYRKPMFCDKCQKFGHTTKFCRSRAKCAKCASEHFTSECQADVNSNNCPYCSTNHENDRNKCPFFCEVNECFQASQNIRRKSRYQHAVATSTRTNCPTAESDPIQIADANHFPTLRNRFDALQEEEVVQETGTSNPPLNQPQRHIRNPYSTVVKKGTDSTHNVRRAPKRIRPLSSSNVVNSTAVRESVREKPTTQESRKPSSLRPQPRVKSTLPLKAAILSIAKNAGLADIWISVLEAIIEPLLMAIMPQLPDLLGALGSSVLNRQP